VKCLPAGFFIRPDYPFLGTSPDGVIDDEYLIEVKCPYSGHGQALFCKKINCVK
jgi:hypothetical protein